MHLATTYRTNISEEGWDVNHNTITPIILMADEVSKPQRGVDVLPQSGWQIKWGMLSFQHFPLEHADHFYFLCFLKGTIWLPLLNGILQALTRLCCTTNFPYIGTQFIVEPMGRDDLVWSNPSSLITNF